VVYDWYTEAGSAPSARAEAVAPTRELENGKISRIVANHWSAPGCGGRSAGNGTHT